MKHFLSLFLATTVLATTLACAGCAPKASETMDLNQSTVQTSSLRTYEPVEGAEAEIIDPGVDEPIDPARILNGLPDDPAEPAVLLAMSSGSEQPAEGTRSAVAYDQLQPQTSARKPASALISLPRVTIPIETIRPTLPIYKPTPTPVPVSRIQVIQPEAASQWTVGQELEIEWLIDSGREIQVDILLSTNKGRTFSTLVQGYPSSEGEYSVPVPDSPSNDCIIQIDAWVGSSLLGSAQSGVFTIQSALRPSPTPEPTPVPTPTPSPSTTPTPKPNLPQPAASVYIFEPGQFIPAGPGSVRWFNIEYDLSGVDRAIWQIARVPFTETSFYNKGLDWQNPPGLLASGELDAAMTEFKLDFSAILHAAESVAGLKSDGMSGSVKNLGEKFQLASAITLSEQSQRELYIRLVLIDKDSKVLGTSGSGFQVIYGQANLDLAGMLNDSGLSAEEWPYLTAKDGPGFSPGAYEPLQEKPIVMSAKGVTDWGFSLENTPVHSTEIDLQIATVPFESQSISQYQEPAGLVYEVEAANLSYTTKTRYYPVSFAKFAPSAAELGEQTMVYYIRAVCYLPGKVAGTVIPVATEAGKIIYTGNMKVYLASQMVLPDFPPEEVVVQSYVPNTDFQRYIPPQWELDHADEYFEVTRPIQAEEICFFIKNSKTGDFLYPYPIHLQMYPGTTREQYQAVVDRMLPPGAWFHLTMTQSGWDQFWSEFFQLLSDIYSSIQQAYNDAKSTIANGVADQFAFLGDDIQSVIRTAVHGLMNYGLASIGLPPTLPNFEQLSEQGLDYCVRVALDEAAQSMGVPVDQLPDAVRQEIVSELDNLFAAYAKMKHINPLDVDYLKPAAEAMYRPAYVDVKIFNHHNQRSPAGTLTLSYHPVNKPAFKLYEYKSLPIPALDPQESTFIRIFLKPDNTDLPVWKDYFSGKTGSCQFNLTVKYNVPDVDVAAKQQGVSGNQPLMDDVYVYDTDPVVVFEKIAVPNQAFFD